MNPTNKLILDATGPIDEQALDAALTLLKQHEGSLSGRPVRQVKEKPTDWTLIDTALPGFAVSSSDSQPTTDALSLTIPEEAPKTPSAELFKNALGPVSGDGKLSLPPTSPTLAKAEEEPLVSLELPESKPFLLPHWEAALKVYEGVSLTGRTDLVQQILQIVHGRLTALPKPLYDEVMKEAASIKELYLVEMRHFTPHAMREIAKAFTGLESLELSHCQTTDAHLQFLKDMPHLTCLRLEGGKASKRGLNMIADSCPKLVELELGELPGSRPQDLEPLKRFTTLHKLTLRYCKAIDDSSIVYVLKLSALKILDCAGSWLTNRGVRLLGESRDLRLEKLDIGLNQLITYIYPLRHMHTLEALETDYHVSDFNRAELLARRPDLYIMPRPSWDAEELAIAMRDEQAAKKNKRR